MLTRPDRHAAVLAAGQFHRLGTVLHIPARDVPGFLAGVPRYLAILRLADLERVPPPPRSRPILVTARYVLFASVPRP